jgi:GNAT superfamily N-acetyltransferase
MKKDNVMKISIQQATEQDASAIAVLVGELLSEIMSQIGVQAFHFDLTETQQRLADFIQRQQYFVLIARNDDNQIIGFIAAYESYALYAEGAFATIAELYVRPEYRCHGVGQQLTDALKLLGRNKGWKRLEVTTPPLPEFDKTLGFYEREGFEITGGRKLKVLLNSEH